MPSLTVEVVFLAPLPSSVDHSSTFECNGILIFHWNALEIPAAGFKCCFGDTATSLSVPVVRQDILESLSESV